jgi:hypothetical protein
MSQKPNQALEPTTPAVTPRAIFCLSEWNHRPSLVLPHAARRPWSWLIFDVRRKTMKWVILILWLSAVSGLIGAATGIQRLSFGREITIEYGTPSGRMFSLAVGILCTAAAYTCMRKKKAGWWLVIAIIVSTIVLAVWGLARVAATDPAFGVASLAQIVFMGWLLRWWLKQVPHFSSQNPEA